METAIINGLFTLAGVLIGSFVSWLCARDAKKMDELKGDNLKLRHNLKKMGEQIKSYWTLERMCAHELSKHIGKNEETILKDNRQIIESRGFERPTMTSNDVDNIYRDCKC